MAGQLWNRINIPLPSAVSTVSIHFSSTTDANFKNVLVEKEKIFKLIQSEILQTEMRVLYELLYVLNNSYRGNKTFKGLKQVEQCLNRLKVMKLDAALQELTELCPNSIQRRLSFSTGKCDVPSQPFLEWICLKVLGAGQLMSCTLQRCSRAFILSKQQMKWEEFVILNVVISSMLSRLWVICRGILVTLSTLYQHLLELLKEVANAQPMPFLTNISLPADMSQILDPSDVFLLKKQSSHIFQNKHLKEKRMKTTFVQVKEHSVKEDLGVAIERGLVFDADSKPFLSVFCTLEKGCKTGNRQAFRKGMREAKTFTDLAAHLDERITWCTSRKMMREKHLLSFLRLKCQRMKYLEAEGYNVQRKLRAFKQDVCWASSPQGPGPRRCLSSFATRGRGRLATHFHTLRSRVKASAVQAGVKIKCLKRQSKGNELSVTGWRKDNQKRTRNKATSPLSTTTTNSDSYDDIDNIFASAGL